MTAILTRAAFVVGAKDFASAVGWAAKRVPSRPAVPTLGGILLEVAQGALTVSGFDYDASASAHLPVEGASDGRVLVSGRLLAALVGTFPDRPIEAVAGDKLLTLTCGRAQVALPLMPVEDYPDLPHLPTAIGEVDGNVLARSVKLVGSSCDFNKEKGAEAFTGISLRFDTHVISVDATNRHRGGWEDIPWQISDYTAVGASALPLGSHLTDAVADLAGDDETVTIGLADGLLSLATASRSVVLRLLAVPFVQFRNRIPAPSPTPVAVDVAELKMAADRVRLGAVTAVPHAQLAFGPDELIVRGTTEDAVVAGGVPIEYEGQPVTHVISVRYLLGALAAVGTATARLSIDSGKPVIVFEAPGGTYRHFVILTNPKMVGA